VPLAEVPSTWLFDVLREDHLTTLFQPIVSASDLSAGFGYECLTRGRGEDGQPIAARDLFQTAAAARLLFQLDRASRVAAIEAAGRHGVEGTIFIIFDPTSIYDPDYCLRSTFQAARRDNIDPARVVFEVVETGHVEDPDRWLSILALYRQAGFRVALDDVGAGYSSLNLLVRLRPDFIKLDMALIRGVDRDPFKATIAGKLLEAARDLGVRTIAEGVETDEELGWLRVHGADLVQGFLVARPATPPPSPPLVGTPLVTTVPLPVAVG